MFNEVRKCPTSDPETVSTLVDREGTAVSDEQCLLALFSPLDLLSGDSACDAETVARYLKSAISFGVLLSFA